MVVLLDLWLPILLSAVFVFLISSVIHMATPMHKADFQKLPDEDAVLEGLRQQRVPPGAYMFPMCASMKEMSSPEMIARYNQGPVGHMVVRPSGPPPIGPSLGQWFVYSILIAVFVGYAASVGLGRGADFMDVFRLAGTVGILGFAFGQISESIWKAQSWAVSFRYVVDGTLYGLATGLTFAWLWPGA